MSHDEDPARAADALCTQCGICCDGTLYGSVVVAAHEVPRLQRIGLPILIEQGAATMRQPCAALRGLSCSVYADRPTTCGDYQCSLRRGVAAGASLPSARQQVARMHELLATIRAGFECAPGDSIWERILAFETPATAEAEHAAAARMAPAIAAVGELLQLARAAFEPRFAGAGRR